MIARLVSYTDLVDKIRHFTFEVPAMEKLAYSPGQFVSLSEMVAGKRITRAYSIANAPSDGNRFEICLNLVDDGAFSPLLFRMGHGDTVEMKGPLGTFVWRDSPVDSIFVATGTGIVPYRAMLQAYPARRATLIYGTRHPENLLWRNEFEQLAEQHPAFRFLPTVTRPDDTWRGRTGRVQPLLLDEIGERRDLHIYACGLREMVDSVRELLKGMGFDRRQIITEKYD